jgi:MinD-like ATPase involved in chromosome partitioning or flagellar assembly
VPAAPGRPRKRAGGGERQQRAARAAAGRQGGRQPDGSGQRRAASRADADADRDDAIRRSFGGFRQVTVVNPGQGAGRSTATLLLAAAFGQVRGVGVIAWDAGSGDPGGRPAALVTALAGGVPLGRGQLATYLDDRGGCDVLGPGAADTDADFGAVRDTLARLYQLAIVDSGNDLRGEAWHRVVEASDQLVVTIPAASSASGSAAVRLLDRLERDGQRRLVRHAVTVVTAAGGRLDAMRHDADLAAIQRHFASRTRAVHVVPNDRALAAGPARFGSAGAATRAAWLRIAAEVADGL